MKKAILTVILMLTLGNSAFAVTMLSDAGCKNSTAGRHDQTAAPAEESNYQSSYSGGTAIYEGKPMSNHGHVGHVSGGQTRASLAGSLLRGI